MDGDADEGLGEEGADFVVRRGHIVDDEVGRKLGEGIETISKTVRKGVTTKDCVAGEIDGMLLDLGRRRNEPYCNIIAEVYEEGDNGSK